jgi:hypothetical protein
LNGNGAEIRNKEQKIRNKEVGVPTLRADFAFDLGDIVFGFFKTSSVQIIRNKEQKIRNQKGGTLCKEWHFRLV